MQDVKVYPNGLSIAPNGSLPSLSVGLTEQQLTYLASRLALVRLADSLGGRLSFATLPALAYVASLRVFRRLRVRHPEWERLCRICIGIQDVCYWALGLSFRSHSDLVSEAVENSKRRSIIDP